MSLRWINLYHAFHSFIYYKRTWKLHSECIGEILINGKYELFNRTINQNTFQYTIEGRSVAWNSDDIPTIEYNTIKKISFDCALILDLCIIICNKIRSKLERYWNWEANECKSFFSARFDTNYVLFHLIFLSIDRFHSIYRW